MNQRAVDLDDLRAAFGFGVAGNFAGHLEQAGEATDFTNVAAPAAMPKGIFPWYAPRSSTFLGAFPLSSDTLTVPDPAVAPGRIQIEPEVGVLCDVERGASCAIERLRPRWVAAFDDCSLRRPNARRISEKKNWGDGSKGVAPTAIPVTNLDSDGDLALLRLASFLVRGGETHAYGVDSPTSTYSLVGEELLAWLVDRLTHQRSAPDTPLEDVGALLVQSHAERVLVGIGATRYEQFGETVFVEPGDDAVVVLYDSRVHDPDVVASSVAAGRDDHLTAASVLRRRAR